MKKLDILHIIHRGVVNHPSVLDLKLKICECDMSLQTVESDGSRRKKEKEDRDDLRSENCSIDMIRVEEDQLVLLELGP